MPWVSPFFGARYDPDRVALERAIVPAGLDGEGREAARQAEPRCALRLYEPWPASALWRSELLRAGVLLRDEEPALYAVRQLPEAEDEEEARLGFFGLVEPGRGQALVRLSATPGPARCAFVDDKRRVTRILRAATEEREADARLELGGELLELFVVDDETSCARIAAHLEQAAVFLVEGGPDHGGDPARGASAPFVAFLAPLDGRSHVLGANGAALEVGQLQELSEAAIEERAAGSSGLRLSPPVAEGLVFR